MPINHDNVFKRIYENEDGEGLINTALINEPFPNIFRDVLQYYKDNVNLFKLIKKLKNG